MVHQHLVTLVPAKIPRVAVYLSEEVKADLEQLANAERRSISQMAAMLIEEAIARAKADGRLQPEDDSK
jgi:predicted transcriptional regulator